MIEINHFLALKLILLDIVNKQPEKLFHSVQQQNPWFTKKYILLALKGIITWFEDNNLLVNWLNDAKQTKQQKRIAIIMAGNIPFVGIHDLLCVIATDNIAVVKYSHQDNILPKYCIQKWIEKVPSIANYIIEEDEPQYVDALIATGSNNTARYFDYKYSSLPKIIRKNRTSVAIVEEGWNDSMYKQLAKDITSYYGRGCRSISKVIINNNNQLNAVIKAVKYYLSKSKFHQKYINNYRFYKSVFLLENTTFVDLEFLLLMKSSDYFPPISVLFYDYYDSKESIEDELNNIKDILQCIVSSNQYLEHCYPINTVLPGQSQSPSIGDYADNVNTLKFLSNL